ncbi:unnamed protein product [Meloidogyne enterolobii]
MQKESEKMSKECPSQNNGTIEENEIKIEKMEKEIKEMVKEQAKLNEKIKILEDTKTDLGKLVEQIKNLEAKIAVIDDKENKRFDDFYEMSKTNFNTLQKAINEHSKRMDIIEKEKIFLEHKGKENEIKIQKMEKLIEKIVNEKNELFDKINIFEYAKNDFENFEGPTMGYFEDFEEKEEFEEEDFEEEQDIFNSF